MDAARTSRVTGAALAAAGLAFATTTAITSGLPDIARDLDATQTEVQYVQDIYTVVLGALVLPCGAILDRYGRRRWMLIGLALLAVCQLWLGLAQSPLELILSRAAAGVGAALVLPGTLATITSVLDSDSRARAVSLWAGSTMFGAGVGMIIAGAGLELATWRAPCFAMAVLAVAMLAVVWRWVPETYDPEHANIDPVGAALSCVGFAALIVAIIEAPVAGVLSPVVVVSAIAGVVFTGAFISWELRVKRPLIDLRLFGDTSFSVGTVSIVLLFVAGYGWFFLVFQYFTNVLDYGPLQSAIGLCPLLVALIPGAIAGPRLAARFGRRTVISCALLAIAIGSAVMAGGGVLEEYWVMAIGILIFGLGIGVGQSPPTEAIVEALPASKQGVASAVNDAAREIGASIGVAIMGSLFNAGYRDEVAGHLDGLAAPVGDAVREGPAAGLGVASSNGAFDARITDAVEQGVVAGWLLAFMIGLLLFLLAALIVERAGERTEILDAPLFDAPDPAFVTPAYGPRRRKRVVPPA